MESNNTDTHHEKVGDLIFLCAIFYFTCVLCAVCVSNFYRDRFKTACWCFCCCWLKDYCKKRERFYVEPIEDPPELEMVPKNKVVLTRSTCSICMEVKYKMVERKCGHQFCRTCNDAWKEKSPTCPLCRETS